MKGPTDEERGPEVAVVIPTRLRETRLAFALEALASQSLDRSRFEVVVVRAPDAVDVPLCEAPVGLNVRFLVSPIASPAAQRNVGWRAARAPLIAFTDDDCRPPPGWLGALLAASESDDVILQGRTEPDPDEEHLYWGYARSWRITEENGWYATCNMAYPRALLERVGGFDESFPGAWGEDTDLGLRATKSGAEQRYVDEALTWHAVLPRALPAAIREARRRDATVAVLARHPEHRSELHWRYFAHARHARLLLALCGLVAAGRRPALSALAAAPYLLGNIDRRRLRPRTLVRQLLHAPSQLVFDLVGMAVIARAAVRERVLLI